METDRHYQADERASRFADTMPIMPGVAIRGSPQVYTSGRFLKSYQKQSGALQALIEGEVQDFVRHYRSDPRKATFDYDRLEHLKPETVLELEVTGANRILAAIHDGKIVLLEAGDHSVVSRYSRNLLIADLRTPGIAADKFRPGSRAPRLFEDFALQSPTVFKREMHPDWIY